ncbi:LysR family transcriptional regulator [Arthrobacter wenxiniae]|uniref:LysR family transcriptional regulator n=1 Tax=Arthrobacter wenxiniae TaxID=2713570 RepID=A0A7Y7IJT7_9MICC|nr:LysR family transcriptional regulator [Arthrobacter wenxiniae]NVM96435.1 LysR family transcriptional regulator [Arthrobacter wenxiniae]
MAMTARQLQAFALVAKLGSLHAAAAALGVSEPAVSAALAALRRDLGDVLFVRAGSGIALTPGGRVLAIHAEEVVGLVAAIRRDVSQAQRSGQGLRVLATAAFAEHAAGRLLDVFARRHADIPLEVVVEGSSEIAALLTRRSYDIALGARPELAAMAGVESVPVLRYRRVLVAAPSHPLARFSGPAPAPALLEHQWFAGPRGIEKATEEGRWLAAVGRPPDVVNLTSETDALAAVRAGEGVMLALEHVVRAELGTDALVAVVAAGTPITGMWWASTLDRGRSTGQARALQRFAATAEATAAMVARRGSRGLAQRGSKVHVALWS